MGFRNHEPGLPLQSPDLVSRQTLQGNFDTCIHPFIQQTSTQCLQRAGTIINTGDAETDFHTHVHAYTCPYGTYIQVRGDR